MKIVFLSHPQPRNSGDYKHRVLSPGLALAKFFTVIDVQTSHPDAIKICLNADLLIIGMISDHRVSEIIDKRSFLGKKTVYEISDDFLDFPSHLPISSFYRDKNNQEIIISCAKKVDLLQFSSYGLKSKFSYLNKNHVVFMNNLPDSICHDSFAKKKGPFILGWAGSLGHFEDARLVAEAFSLIKKKNIKVVFHVMASKQFMPIFHEFNISPKWSNPGSFEQYLNFLKQLDIGLALLHPSEFAEGRSDGKFLEYASCGAVCLANNVGEYKRTIKNRETGFLFDSLKDLSDFFLSESLNRDFLTKIANNAKEYIFTERAFPLAIEERFEKYSSMLSIKTCGAGNNYFFSIEDDIEQIFNEATLLHANGSLDHAFAKYHEILNLRPDFYLPWERISHLSQQVFDLEGAELYKNTSDETFSKNLLENWV